MMRSARAILTPSNVLSLSRLPLALAFWLAPTGWPRAAILVAGGFTDFLDGWLARRQGRPSPGGELIDPVTDKVFVLAVLAALAFDGSLAIWEVLVLLMREVFIAIGLAVVVTRRTGMRLRARMPGKVALNLQLLALLVASLRPDATPPFVLIAGAAGLVAVIDYGRIAAASLRGSRRPD